MIANKIPTTSTESCRDGVALCFENLRSMLGGFYVPGRETQTRYARD